ncbi:MAG: DUF551 domain-containing protein [Emcibacter sp.]|nr:DUF551 domain-containing protein [Emcibacter sp.]
MTDKDLTAIMEETVINEINTNRTSADMPSSWVYEIALKGIKDAGYVVVPVDRKNLIKYDQSRGSVMEKFEPCPKYPIRSTARVFRDEDGNECTLLQLINRCPEWAKSRILYLEEAAQKLADDVTERQWRPPETSPMGENISFLVWTKNKTDSEFCIVQVSRFEGRIYADSKESVIDWEDGIEDATHWMPLPTPPEGGNDAI